jgi:hypothetical protein
MLTMANTHDGTRPTDFTIKTDAKEHHVYRDVISKSEYFRAASCFGIEAQNQSITLHDDDDSLVGLMITFLYADDCDTSSVRPDPAADELSWIRNERHETPPNVVVYDLASTTRVPNHVKTGTLSHADRSIHLRQSNEDKAKLDVPSVQPAANRRGPGAALYHTPTTRYLLLHLQLWEVVDKYAVPAFQALCATRFTEAAMYYSEHVEFIDAIEYVYEELPHHATALR